MNFFKSTARLLALASLSIPAFAFGSMDVTSASGSVISSSTKGAMLTMAANAMIAAGHAKTVEGCSDLEADQLFACVYRNTNMSADLLGLPESTLLQDAIEVGYFDDSGDCAIRVIVQLDLSAEVSEWSCY